MSAPAVVVEALGWHVPTFSEALQPLGWQRCAVCGELVDRLLWARRRCLGPPAPAPQEAAPQAQ